MADGVDKARAEKLVDDIRTAEGTDAQQDISAELWNIAKFGWGSWTSLMDAGLATALATALHEWDDVEAKKNCMLVIIFLCDNLDLDCERMQSELVEAGVLVPMVALLAHNDDECNSIAEKGLYKLTLNNSATTQQLRDVPDVMEALEVETDSEKSLYSKIVLDSLRSLSPSGRAVKPARA